MSEQIKLNLDRLLPTELDYYVLLDFDRCIANTERLQSILEEVVSRHSFIKPRDMQMARRNSQQTAGSFDTASWLKQRLDEAGQPELWQKIANDFVASSLEQNQSSDSEVLMPGARQLIDQLKARQIPYGFLTFGSYDWQVTKLRAAGQANIPQMIVDKKEKGRFISSWQQDDKFLLPIELSMINRSTLVKHLAFLDDKPDSFIGAPPIENNNMCLIHVKDPSGSVVKSQRGNVPPGVTTVLGLAAAQEKLFNHYHSVVASWPIDIS